MLFTENLINNKIENLPENMFKMVNLRELLLQDNKITFIPKSFKKMKDLSYLDLSGSNNISVEEQKNIQKYLPDTFISFPE